MMPELTNGGRNQVTLTYIRRLFLAPIIKRGAHGLIVNLRKALLEVNYGVVVCRVLGMRFGDGTLAHMRNGPIRLKEGFGIGLFS